MCVAAALAAIEASINDGYLIIQRGVVGGEDSLNALELFHHINLRLASRLFLRLQGRIDRCFAGRRRCCNRLFLRHLNHVRARLYTSEFLSYQREVTYGFGFYPTYFTL